VQRRIAVEDHGRSLGNHRGGGRRDVNDGVLLIAAPDERRAGIEVGSGIEAALADERAGAIIQNDILPRFRTGQMPEGIVAGSEAIIREITR